MNALHHRRHAFESHTGVDRGTRQVRLAAIGPLVVLHEYEVPDLDEAIPVLVRRAWRSARDILAMVVEDFGGRPARTGVAHRPEIIRRRDANDAAVRQAGNPLPQIERFVVGVINGRGKTGGVQTPFPCQQGPGLLDRALFEIVAETEVSEHLEEGVMSRGVADIVKIVVLTPGAHTFLAAGSARGGGAFEAREHVLERDHPRIDEHERRIAERHERRAGDAFVLVGSEEIEKTRPDIVGRLHDASDRSAPGTGQAGKRAIYQTKYGPPRSRALRHAGRAWTASTKAARRGARSAIPCMTAISAGKLIMISAAVQLFPTK